MPRPRVDARNRKRTAEACLRCKTFKKKCDGARPCGTCSKAGKRDSCRFASSPDERHSSTRHPSQRSEQEQTATSPGTTASNHQSTDSGQMLWTSRGSQVFVGNSGSLSFLHLLRNMFVKFSGPSAFTTEQSPHVMLERASEPLTVNCEHNVEGVEELMAVAHAATCGILCFPFDDQVLQICRQPGWADQNTSINAAMAHAVLAIGAQCRASSDIDIACAANHAAKAQRIASERMLEDLNIYLVWAFLLLAFYLLGACRRNAAFLCIGIAVRAAAGLGLHDQKTYDLAIDSALHLNRRQQTWQSLRVLDQLVSAVLGRPPATAAVSTRSNREGLVAQDHMRHRDAALDATCRVWVIIDAIVHRLYDEDAFSIAEARSFLGELKAWSSSISPELRSQPVKANFNLADRENTIGNLHVACSYYYAVILATRKALVSHLAARLAETTSPMKSPPSSATSPEDEHAELADTCVKSALLLLQTCRDVYNTNMLFANMCLLKAWIFAAAMVVAFAMFSKEAPDPELEDGYAAAHLVLAYLSICSQQAKEYADILHSIFRAIQQHQRKLRTTSPLVERIFEIGFPLQQSASPPNAVLDSTGPAFDGSLQYGSLGQGNNMPFDAMDSVATQVWDDFLLGHDLSSFVGFSGM